MTGKDLLKKYDTFYLILLLIILTITIQIIYINNYNLAQEDSKTPRFHFEDSYGNINKVILIDQSGVNSHVINLFDSPFIYSYWILSFSTLTGINLFNSIFLFNLLFYFIFIILIFVFIKKFAHKIIAFFTILIFASNPYSLVMFSDPIRIVQVIFLGILSCFFYLTFLEDNKNKYLIISGILISIGFMIHYAIILFFIPICGHILLINKRKFSTLIIIILSTLPIILSWFFIQKIFSYSGGIPSIPLITRYWDALAQTLFNGFKSSFGTSFLLVVADNLGYGGIVFLSLAFIFGTITIRNYKKDKEMSLIVLLLIFILIFFILAYPASSHYSRYPTYAFIPIILLSLTLIYKRILLLRKPYILIFLLTIFILLTIFPIQNSNIFTYSNLYVSRVSVGELISQSNNSGRYAIEGWPSMITPIIKADKSDKVFLLGFDLNQKLTTKLNTSFIQSKNISYFVYEEVTCFNAECPNNYYYKQFIELGYKLNLDTQIKDPVSESRYIKIYKIIPS